MPRTKISTKLHSFSQTYGLTTRQCEILHQLVEQQNMTADAIAESIRITPSTVNVHLSKIFIKVGCRNKAELMSKYHNFMESEEANKNKQRRLVKILMIDDDLDFINNVSEVLKDSMGDTVTLLRAHNGQEALEHLSRGKLNFESFELPDLMLVDLVMPKVDGFVVVERIKTDPELKNIPMIVFSSHADPTQVKRVYDLGANSFIVKPTSRFQTEKILTMMLQYWCDYGVFPPKSNEA